MRDIKFRAWDNDRKEINHKVLVGNTSTDDENYTSHCILIDSEWKNFDEFSDVHLMQFTGLTDKNGVDIYEGDVVKCKQGWLGVVNYYSSRAYYACEEIVTKRVNSHAPIFDDWDELEVIGNIHENKDLLDKK